MSNKTNPTATNEDGKPALVPKLRFPEFRGAVAWHEGQIADIAVSESSSRALNKLSLKSEGYPVYGADSCVGFIDSFDQANDYIAIVKDGSGVGRLALKKGKSSILGTLAYIKCKPSSETKLTWLYYCLNSLDLRQFIKGSGIPHIYFSDYASHQVLIPSPPEQQKIAECLSSVDELIAAQARKLDALKTHKKGLMQQLFPREGETQPRLRFPEFQNAGEWNPTNFGALRLDVSDGNYSSKYPSQSDFVANGIPFLRANNLRFGTVSDDDMRFISKEQHSQITKGHLKRGDILITTRGELGTVSLVPDRHIGSNINAQIVRINTSNKLVNTFLFQLLDYSRVIGLFDALSTGTALKQLPVGKLNQLALRIPEFREEQQRVADCLSSLDDLIAAQTQTLEALKTHKQGLMHQLFPLPDTSQHIDS